MARTPSTLAAHRLIELAQRQGVGQAVVDDLFRAYFEAAQDVGDPKVLEEIAQRSRVSGWPQESDAREVAALEEEMRALGISAVPTFIFDRKLGVSGAHPAAALAQAMREALSAK